MNKSRLARYGGTMVEAKRAIFLTNDDGVEAPGLHALICALHQRGHPLVVLAPESEQSASGMGLSLHKNLSFKVRDDVIAALNLAEGGPPLQIYSLNGTPCDCVIVALDGRMHTWDSSIEPALCISGMNHGANLSVDVMHSGTVSAARESCLYGMPAIAASLATREHADFDASMDALLPTIDAALSCLPLRPENLLRPEGTARRPWSDEGLLPDEKCRAAFANADLLLNLNVPERWTGEVRTSSLGARWYRNATESKDVQNMGVVFEVGEATIIDEDLPGTDCVAIGEGAVAITPLSAWPIGHPLSLSEEIMATALISDESGMPRWLSSD